jgi:hypothetical protein|tara:strand:+ start:218 stop:733 length:516 start_codon:yes stop_codon:yes gene_type:complete
MKIFNVRDNSHLKDFNAKSSGTFLFSHPQCQHCINMKPDWDKAKQLLMRKKKPCNIYEVDGQSMGNINHPISRAVQGFPTILNVNKGKISPFEKERNFKNILNFILSNIKKKSTKNIRFTNRLVNNVTLNRDRFLKNKTQKNKDKKNKTKNKKGKNKKGKNNKGGNKKGKK